MKKWNKPEILKLGVSLTNEDPINIWANNGNGTSHFCHREGDCINGNDHSASENKDHVWSGGICSEHRDTNGVGGGQTDSNGQHACCCFGLS